MFRIKNLFFFGSIYKQRFVEEWNKNIFWKSDKKWWQTTFDEKVKSLVHNWIFVLKIEIYKTINMK